MYLKKKLKSSTVSTGNKVIVLLLLAVFSFRGYAQTDSVNSFSTATLKDFSEEMQEHFADPEFSNAVWGVVIQSLSTGEYFFKLNDSKLLMPASNMKLVTTAAGLVTLGPDYRFKTELHARGTIDGSILYGDLIIRGFGDPTISGRFYKQDMYQVFSDWADSLLELGIDEVRGNILGDDNVFDDKGAGYGWSIDDETFWYAAETGAITFNENCVDIVIHPTATGSKARLAVDPETKYIIVFNNVMTVSRDSITSVTIERERGTNVVKITGTIKENSPPFRTYSTVNNPTQFAMVVLKDILDMKGISVSGYVVDIDDIEEVVNYRNTRYLFTYYSPPLKDIIKVINKDSQNLYAEQLLKILGYEVYGKGSAENGVRVVKDFMNKIGVNSENMVIADGSGLSRYNLISTGQISQVLGYMFRHEYFPFYYESLSVAGTDGTLGKRMTKTNAVGNVHAKTGYISNVRSLSGFVSTGDKEPVSFSIIANNFIVPVKLAERMQDYVCTRLASFKRK